MPITARKQLIDLIAQSNCARITNARFLSSLNVKSIEKCSHMTNMLRFFNRFCLQPEQKSNVFRQFRVSPDYRTITAKAIVLERQTPAFCPAWMQNRSKNTHTWSICCAFSTDCHTITARAIVPERQTPSCCTERGTQESHKANLACNVITLG